MLREILSERVGIQHVKNYYDSQEKFVLTNGTYMTSSEPLTNEQYAYLGMLSECIECLPKQCFHNAQLMTLVDSYNPSQRVTYYEGYVCKGITPILHAWITLDDKIVDVTLSTCSEAAQRLMGYGYEAPQQDLRDRVIGTIPEGWEYMGVPFENEYVVGNLLKNMESRSLIDNWQDGWPLLTTTGECNVIKQH
jgi:hypothetical protein